MKENNYKPMTQREIIYFIMASFCQLMAIIAIFVGLFLPPRGVIDGSVITYFGLTSGFTGSLLGLTSWVKNDNPNPSD